MDTSAIIVAAGSSRRMNGTDKILAEIKGIPVIIRTLTAFQNSEEIKDIVVVTTDANLEIIKNLSEKYNITKAMFFTVGGNTRQESVMKGLKLISKETQYIAIHDGARPLIKTELIDRTIKDARVFGAATLGVPVKDTIKTVNDSIITDTPDRNSLFAIQTPQVFRRKTYFEGANFATAHQLDFTDDCQLIEAVGLKVYVTKGDYINIKITTPEDIKIAEAILN